VKQQDASHFLDGVGVRLHRVSGADDVFGIDAVEMRDRIFNDAIVAVFDRPVAGDRDNRMRVTPGAIGVAATVWRTGLLGVMPNRLPEPRLRGSTLKSPVFRARSAPIWTMRTGRVRNRPKSSATGYSVR
jgi:hypothetical protein